MKGEEFPDHLVNDLTIAMHNHLVSHTHTHSYSNEINESERRKVMATHDSLSFVTRGWSEVFLWSCDFQIM